MSTKEEFEDIVNKYESLRNAVYTTIGHDSTVMGEYAWLRPVLTHSDINLDIEEGKVNCWGSVYTDETMSNEWFDFHVPIDVVSQHWESPVWSIQGSRFGDDTRSMEKKDRNWDLRDMGNPDPPSMLDWTTEEYLANLEES